MWRNLLLAGAICTGGAAAAQQSLDDLLAATSVFDCASGEGRTVYVFESDAQGDVTPLGERAGLETLPDDLRALADKRYLVFQGGEDTPGACLTVTEIARGVYPALTAAFLPEMAEDVGEADPAALAAAVTIRDLEARLGQSEAANRDLEARLAGAEAANRDLEARLAQAEARGEELQAALDASEAALGTAQARIDALDAEVAGLRSDLIAETAAHSAAAMLALDLKAQLADATAALQAVEADRRALVASSAILGQRKISLEGELKGALDEAEDARTATVAMQNLADSAVLRIATLQQRDPDSVRAEVCLFLQGDRPELCQ